MIAIAIRFASIFVATIPSSCFPCLARPLRAEDFRSTEIARAIVIADRETNRRIGRLGRAVIGSRSSHGQSDEHGLATIEWTRFSMDESLRNVRSPDIPRRVLSFPFRSSVSRFFFSRLSALARFLPVRLGLPETVHGCRHLSDANRRGRHSRGRHFRGTIQRWSHWSALRIGKIFHRT